MAVIQWNTGGTLAAAVLLLSTFLHCPSPTPCSTKDAHNVHKKWFQEFHRKAVSAEHKGVYVCVCARACVRYTSNVLFVANEGPTLKAKGKYIC